MLLVSVEKAANAIGAKCGASVPTSDEVALRGIINLLTPKVEAALNVHSIVHDYHTDRFILPYKPYPSRNPRAEPPKVSLRLTSGFVIPDSVQVIDPNGDTVDLTSSTVQGEIEHELGVVHLSDWGYGKYLVHYDAGFAPESEPATPGDGYDANERVLEDVPDWIIGIVITYLVQWYRNTVLAPKRNKEVPWALVEQGLIRDLNTRIYGRYMRPRDGVIWGDREY
jgi:hypothetical protein